MTRWMDFIERDNPDYLRTRNLGNSYNDWLAPGDDETSPELLATAYWAYDAALMAEIADAAGHPEQAAGYRALRAKIGAAFAGAFLAADGQLTSGTQTAYVLGLHMQLIPDELRPAAADHLVAAIRRADWHLSTGFAGVGYLLPVLSGTGHTDVAYRLLEQETAPSWRYMVDHGATTIWERWDGWTEQRGFQSRVDELVQPLRARLGRRMAVPVRARHRPGAGPGRLRPAADPAAPRRLAARRQRQLPLGTRADPQRMAAGRRDPPAPGRDSA